MGDFSEAAAIAAQRMRSSFGGCDFRHYTNADEVWPAWKQSFDALHANPRMQSDLLRHSVLRKYGGLWLDLDVTLLVSPEQLASGWVQYTALRLIPASPIINTDIIFVPADWSGWPLIDEYVASVDVTKRLGHLAFAHHMLLHAYRRGAPMTVFDNGSLYPCRASDVSPAAHALRCGQQLSPGLGDMVAAGLAAVGITKDRVQAVANKVGIKDCGCKKRQAALNRAGQYLGLPPGQQS